ncbi:ABC-2 type transport system permease protein [Bacillus sp. OV322]|uniref:ABC transporter permease n=1 Tax=Bacillus sp. OV322 TaxID=1882764 RepID=UPI0008F1E2BB|nr:ABC transporter permease [Bacillus sp. OV322]SFC87883.1 ABC-2 type transport system permease protein [Bacillus sp. OV322]
MKIIAIAWKDFKIRITDRRGFLMMLIMPLVLTAILGTALKTVMAGDDGIQDTTIGFYAADGDPLSKSFKDEVLKKLDFINIKSADSESSLESLLKSKKIDAGIAIPANWSSGLNEGELKKVKIFSDPDKKIRSQVAESLLTSFSERVKTTSLATKAVMGDLAAVKQVSSNQPDLKSAAKDVRSEIMKAGEQEPQIAEISIGKKMVDSKQYYAAAMCAMFLLYNITIGAKSLLNEKTTETLSRLLISPTRGMSVLIGKFLGTWLFSFIQFTLFFMVTSLFLHVNWGGNNLQVISIGLFYSFAVSGLSMIIAAFISDIKTADLIGSVGLQIMAILGGSMLPIYAFPDALQAISAFTPNHWAITGFLDVMSGTDWNGLYAGFGVLAGIGVLSLFAGTWKLGRKIG